MFCPAMDSGFSLKNSFRSESFVLFETVKYIFKESDVLPYLEKVSFILCTGYEVASQ